MKIKKNFIRILVIVNQKTDHLSNMMSNKPHRDPSIDLKNLKTIPLIYDLRSSFLDTFTAQTPTWR